MDAVGSRHSAPSWRPSPLGLIVAVLLGGACAASLVVATWLIARESAETRYAVRAGEIETSRRECVEDAKLVEEAMARASKAQAELDQFMSDSFVKLRSAAAEFAQQVNAKAGTFSHTYSVTSKEVDRLKSRLHEVEAERTRLLERMTPEHPMARDVEVQATQLRHQLAELEASTSGLPPTLPAPDPLATEPAAAQWSENLRQLVEASQTQYERKLQDLRLAQHNLEIAQGRQAKSLATHVAIMGQPNEAPKAVVVAKPKNVWTMIGWAGCIALITAAITRSIFVWRAKSASTLRRWSDIEQKCALHVMGVVSVATAGGLQPQSTGPTGVRTFALLMQVLIALVVFLMVAMTVQNPNWVGDLPSQPFDAICLGLERLLTR